MLILLTTMSFTLAYFSELVPFFSSSVDVSDAIKTFDMSLPSNGDIKDAKTGVVSVKGSTPKSGGSGDGGVGVIQKRKGSGASLGYSTGLKKSKEAKKPQPKPTSVGEYVF